MTDQDRRLSDADLEMLRTYVVSQPVADALAAGKGVTVYPENLRDIIRAAEERLLQRMRQRYKADELCAFLADTRRRIAGMMPGDATHIAMAEERILASEMLAEHR